MTQEWGSDTSLRDGGSPSKLIDPRRPGPLTLRRRAAGFGGGPALSGYTRDRARGRDETQEAAA